MHRKFLSRIPFTQMCHECFGFESCENLSCLIGEYRRVIVQLGPPWSFENTRVVTRAITIFFIKQPLGRY